MKFKAFLVYVIMYFLVISCSINGNFKGLYSYYKKSFKANPNIFCRLSKNESISSFKSKNDECKVLIINGLDLKKCIQNKSKVLIYLWSPLCKSTVCYPLEIVQSVCDSKKIDVYIVSEYYDIDQMSVNRNLKNIIYGIDTKFYKSSLTSKYKKLFLNDIANIPETYNRYLYFEDGKFIKSYESVYDIKGN